MQIDMTSKNWMALLTRELDEGSGDNKFERVVDPATGLTKQLKLHVIPTLIDRYDVATVLGLTVAMLDYLQNQGEPISTDTLRGPVGEDILNLGEAYQWVRTRLASEIGTPKAP
jgi:hypothetical protein